MARAIQQRTRETRARLINAAKEIIAQTGFEEMRVEEVVLRAGTAKGTFFAHFNDKDTLMELIIGERIDEFLDDLSKIAPPRSVEGMVIALKPSSDFMTSERYVFDLILRYSGAAGIQEIGPIANTFGRQIEIFKSWFESNNFRSDISPELLAEGIQAFLLQAMAANFCALHNPQSTQERLVPYLRAWLLPSL